MDIVIEIGGRLGNVLFELAHGYEYAKNVGAENIYVYASNDFWLKNYETYSDLHFFPLFKGDLDDFIVLNEYSYMFANNFPAVYGPNLLLQGCFESEDYHPKNLLMTDYINQIRNRIENQIISKYEGIVDCVGISVRRGDYIKVGGFFVPSEQWYLDMYHKYFYGRRALIFSDDIEWCKSVFKDESNFTYIENTWNEDHSIILNSLVNLYVMSTCKDHICSCSTYSWWGCKLFEKEGAVNVFHTPRFGNGKIEANNYIPSRWIKEPCNV